MSDLVFQNPKFDALRSALYHTERRKFFDLLNRLSNFAIILLSAGAAAKWAQLVHLREIWIELAILLVATLQLVFDFGGSARVHEFLQRRYYEVLAEIETSATHTEDEMHRWSAKLLMLTADEPMTMRALDAIAYNKAVDAVMLPEEKYKYRQIIRWWHVPLRHLWSFPTVDFSPRETVGTR